MLFRSGPYYGSVNILGNIVMAFPVSTLFDSNISSETIDLLR